MSDTNDQSPPAPDSATPPPSSSDGSTPSPTPPPADDLTGSPSSPPSPSPPNDTPSSSPSPPPAPPESPPPSPPPTEADPPPPPVSNSPPPSTTPPPSPPPQQSTPVVSPPPEKSSPSSPSPPPPPTSRSKKPPPASPPPQEASDSTPPPKSDDDSPPSPPSPAEKSPPPPNSSPSPPPVGTPPEEYAAPPAIPSSNSSSPSSTPTKTTPSVGVSPGPRSSSDSSTSSSSSSSSSPTGTSDSAAQSTVRPSTVVGVAVAGVFLVALIALFFVCSNRRRRRKRSEVYAAPPRYIPAGTTSVKSDGYYSGGQQHNINLSSGPPDSNLYGNSYGSQRGGGAGTPGHESGLQIGGPNPYFSYEEMVEMTNGFAKENVLGEGGFGCVYKGWLPDGKVVAVKQLKAGSGQGEREFKAEVEIISRVHHRHLVSLVGYCISEHHRLLIYEFVTNKTLEHHLHGAGMPVLDWAKRLKIALGAAKGLAYLHEDCHPKIIHRDIKSANILLEDSFEAQVADFGLAKPSNDTHTHISTRVMGTFGYMAPEYASSGKLTDRSDVFSFGVVLLELITGRKSVDPTQPLGDESLVEWARPLLIRALESGDLSELVDPRLENNYIESEMTRMVEAAAACVRHSAPKRPRMVQVARALDCEGEMSDLSNGVKYGQSTIYESGQYNQDIMKFRKMALEDSSEYDMYSGEFGNSREVPRNQSPWNPPDSSSGESETRAFNSNNFGGQRYGSPQSNFGNRRF